MGSHVLYYVREKGDEESEVVGFYSDYRSAQAIAAQRGAEFTQHLDSLGVSFRLPWLSSYVKGDVYVQRPFLPLVEPPLQPYQLTRPTARLLLFTDDVKPEICKRLQPVADRVEQGSWLSWLRDSIAQPAHAVVVPQTLFGRLWGDPYQWIPPRFEPIWHLHLESSTCLIHPGSSWGLTADRRAYALYFSRLFNFISRERHAGSFGTVSLCLNVFLEGEPASAEAAADGLLECIERGDE